MPRSPWHKWCFGNILCTTHLLTLKLSLPQSESSPWGSTLLTERTSMKGKHWTDQSWYCSLLRNARFHLFQRTSGLLACVSLISTCLTTPHYVSFNWPLQRPWVRAITMIVQHYPCHLYWYTSFLRVPVCHWAVIHKYSTWMAKANEVHHHCIHVLRPDHSCYSSLVLIRVHVL